MNKILSLLLWLLLPGVGVAQTAVPTARPTMIVVQTDGTESETTAYDGSAPLTIRLEARPQNLGSRTARYEWRFVADGSTTPFLVRYDETTSYVFAQSGSYSVRLLASFVEGRDTIAYEQEEPFRIAIAESRLEVPNAFTPNGDGVNDVFRVKEGYQSLVSFRALVVNRGGKKVAEWTDPADGWDGRQAGGEAPDGAYYLVIDAKGADGREYKVRKTINLLRHHLESAGGSATP
ncbi:MAG: gliding motility-associated C-terminal domain-containing protein [Bacteroidaceae bacterium]|nr:gliding motility-associated C-terminal domain-containing protein [Bacteroidaceae bacterium]